MTYQTTYFYDLHSDGSARVTLTFPADNRGRVPLSVVNFTMPQGVFDIAVYDLISGHEIPYNLNITSNQLVMSIFLEPALAVNARTIFQIVYSELGVAVPASLTDFGNVVQGIWTFGVGFPLLGNFRLYVKLPASMEPLDISVPNPSVQSGRYLDTDNRWVVFWIAAVSPPSTVYTLTYRIAVRLWAFAVAPALTIVCFTFILRIIRPKAARHAKESKDKTAAYSLWQMSLAIHLAILGVVVASWGLLLSQEINPSNIDVAMLIQLVIAVGLFWLDSSSHETVIRSY